MELSALAPLVNGIKLLIHVTETVTHNKSECQRLGAHAQAIVRLIWREHARGVPKSAGKCLLKLAGTFNDLAGELETLGKASRLKRILWCDSVSEHISDIYHSLDEAVRLCDLKMKIDMARMMTEYKQARRQDSEATKKMFQQVLSNDNKILQLLETQLPQMQEAILGIQKRLPQLEDSPKRSVLARGMLIMQRRSNTAPTQTDDFNVSSLEVIIHEHKKLGEGGFGQVFQAAWLGAAIAVKVMEKGVPPKVLKQEVDVWKKLHHPHILPFYGACLSAEPPFAICALKSNGNAMDYLEKNPQASRYKILHEAALGLVYLHNNSVIHGDIKGSNILVDEHGSACLADFGLSKIKLFTSTMRTSKKRVEGTAHWMSPETMSKGVYNRMSDVYSFSMTIYEIFTGLPPFSTIMDTFLFQLVVDRSERPSRPDDAICQERGLDDDAWSLVEVAWSQDPTLRPSASSIASRLNEKRQSKMHVAPFPEGQRLGHDPSSDSLAISLSSMALREVDANPDISTDSGYASGLISPEIIPTSPLLVRTRSAQLRNPSPSPQSEADRLHAEGQNLLRRHREDGSPVLLDHAVECHRRALQAREVGHPLRDFSLHTLGVALHDQYKQCNSLSSLFDAGHLHRQALELRPVGHPARHDSLHALAIVLRDRFQASGDLPLLEEAIDLHWQALEHRPIGHRKRHYSLHDLAVALRDRYHSAGVGLELWKEEHYSFHEGDLEGAIHFYREALLLRPPGHLWRPDTLHGLGVALRDVFNDTSDHSALIEAASAHREVLTARPRGHTQRHHALYNLGITLHMLYKHSSVPGASPLNVLAEAEQHLREGLALRPPTNPRRHYALYGLGAVLYDLYLNSSNPRTLTEAISCYRESLTLRPKGHPWRRSVAEELSAALRVRFNQVHDIELLQEADDLEMEAASIIR